jgi:hypothetical protein
MNATVAGEIHPGRVALPQRSSRLGGSSRDAPKKYTTGPLTVVLTRHVNHDARISTNQYRFRRLRLNLGVAIRQFVHKL